MHSSVKTPGLKGILILHHTLRNDLTVLYKCASCEGHTLVPKDTAAPKTRNDLLDARTLPHTFIVLHKLYASSTRERFRKHIKLHNNTWRLGRMGEVFVRGATQ